MKSTSDLFLDPAADEPRAVREAYEDIKTWVDTSTLTFPEAMEFSDFVIGVLRRLRAQYLDIGVFLFIAGIILGFTAARLL